MSQIKGLDEVLKRMGALTGKQMIRAIRGGLVRSARIVRDSARDKARALDDPRSPSNIAKNIVTRAGGARSDQREGGVVVKVGVAGGARPAKGNKDTGHWRFLEMGTGHHQAQPFMRPAMEDNVERVINDFASNLDAAITKVVK